MHCIHGVRTYFVLVQRVERSSSSRWLTLYAVRGVLVRSTALLLLLPPLLLIAPCNTSLYSSPFARPNSVYPEALGLYESGIDLLLQGARKEPAEPRRQTLLREVSVHMSRAENLKAALAPPAPPVPPSAAAGRGGLGLGRAGKGTGKGQGQGRGKSALSRPKPSASDVRGSARVSVKVTGGEKTGEGAVVASCILVVSRSALHRYRVGVEFIGAAFWRVLVVPLAT